MKPLTDSNIASPHALVQEWLDSLETQGKSASTIKGYRRGMEHWTAWYEQSGGTPFDPAAVTPRDVRDWIAFQQTVERSQPATINQRLAAASSFYSWAVDQERVNRDPAAGVKALRLPARQPRGLADTDLRRLRRCVHAGGNLRDVAIFEALAGTGLRVSEALTLSVADVLLDARPPHLVVRAGKGGQSRRVPLTAEVGRALRDYLADLARRGLSVKADASLWLGQRGALRNPSTINKLLAGYADQVGVADVTPHTLRHTFATNYLDKHPGDVRGLAAILGHADLRTTMIYTEPDLATLARRMEDVG